MLLAIFFLLVIYSVAVYVYYSGFLYMFRVFSANITCLYNIIVSGLAIMGIAQDKSSKQCHHLLSLATVLEIPT